MELLSEVTFVCCSPLIRSSTFICSVRPLSKVSRGCWRIGVVECCGAIGGSSWFSDVVFGENVLLLSELEGDCVMTR